MIVDATVVRTMNANFSLPALVRRYQFRNMGKLAISGHMVLYYVEMIVTMYMLTMLQGIPWLITFGTMVGSSILCNIISAARIHQVVDFQEKPCGLCMCVFSHLIQMGPLWRYLKLTILYDPDDSEDLLRIKLLHTCAFSIPTMLYLINLYLHQNDTSTIYLVLSAFCFISTVLTVTHFSDFHKKGRYGLMVWVCSMFWRLFMLFSRFSALVWALNSPHNLWIALILGIHFLILMILYQLREQSDETSCSGLRVWLLLLALTNTLDMTIADYKTSLQWLVGYYAFILSENIVMVILWYTSLGDPYNMQHTLWLISVFASFALGLLLALATMSLQSRADSKTSLPCYNALTCCLECRRKKQKRGALSWDSYDTRFKTTYHTNKAFDIGERQKHVDIINNPLGVADAISLSTATNTIGVRTPKASKRGIPDDTENQSAIIQKQIKVEINRQEIASKSQMMSLKPVRVECSKGTCGSVIPMAFFNPQTTTNENQQPNSAPSTSSSTSETLDKPLPLSQTPRRRLLFLTPCGLMTTGDNSSTDRNTSSTGAYRHSKSVSERDLRPRWVDLNRLYYNSLSSSDTAIDSLPTYSEDNSSTTWSPNRLIESQNKVSSWLNNDNRRKPMRGSKRAGGRGRVGVLARTRLNPISNQYETPL